MAKSLEEFILEQIRTRYEHENDRWKFVFGDDPKLISGKGKYYLLNFVGLKEAYDAAKETCPIAADAIIALAWHHMLDLTTLEFLVKDYDKYWENHDDDC